MNHFTPHDLNWARSIIASITPLTSQGPEGSIYPNPKGIPTVDQQIEGQKDCQSQIGSFVEEKSRILHEDIPIPGTNSTLHYASNRVNGYKNTISIPASGETIPNGLKRIIVKVEIAGRTLEQILDPIPNQKAEFVWDGLDHLGRNLKGVASAKINIGFVYDAVYTVPLDDIIQAFEITGNYLTSILTRQEITLLKKSNLEVPIPPNKTKGTLAEGWTLSFHHQVSPMNPSVLHKGDGKIIKNNVRIIKTVAGNGTSSCDGCPAMDLKLSSNKVAVDSEGNIYISDFYDRIRKVDTSGIITTIAGGGNPSDGLGDGGPATDARLSYPGGIAVDSAGNIYIADVDHHRIRKVDTSGIITTVAGNGNHDYWAFDGLPAVSSSLNGPMDVAVDNAGNIYIADYNHHRIRKVDANGIITTVAGTGYGAISVDGGLATDTSLYYPSSVAVDNAGNIYIVDSYSYRIRVVDNAGIITTVAGNGAYGFSGDGGPATDASLN
ncbi:MAG: NHL domain-containing protein, partial [Desulfobacterales bacterium]